MTQIFLITHSTRGLTETATHNTLNTLCVAAQRMRNVQNVTSGSPAAEAAGRGGSRRAGARTRAGSAPASACRSSGVWAEA